MSALLKEHVRLKVWTIKGKWDQVASKGLSGRPMEEGAGWQPGLALSGPQNSVSSLPGQPSINPIIPPIL
jgi:hypothetical protein